MPSLGFSLPKGNRLYIWRSQSYNPAWFITHNTSAKLYIAFVHRSNVLPSVLLARFGLGSVEVFGNNTNFSQKSCCRIIRWPKTTMFVLLSGPWHSDVTHHMKAPHFAKHIGLNSS